MNLYNMCIYVVMKFLIKNNTVMLSLHVFCTMHIVEENTIIGCVGSINDAFLA